VIFVRLRGHRTESLATLAIHLCEAVCIPSLSDELGWSHSQNVGPATKRERDVFESKAFERFSGPRVAIRMRTYPYRGTGITEAVPAQRSVEPVASAALLSWDGDDQHEPLTVPFALFIG